MQGKEKKMLCIVSILLLIDTVRGYNWRTRWDINCERMGPKTEPWGTPQDEGNIKEEEELEVTEKALLERSDLSQLWVEAMMPKLEVRRLRRMVWSMVLNAALRSRAKRTSEKSIISCMIDRINEVKERDYLLSMHVLLLRANTRTYKQIMLTI